MDFLQGPLSACCNDGEFGHTHLVGPTRGIGPFSPVPGPQPLAFAVLQGAPNPRLSPSRLPVQSQPQSPSNTPSFLSTSTACMTPQTSWKRLKKSGPSATTTRAWDSPATPTATPSSSGSSTSACATGSCCPSAWCWPARSSCAPSSS